MEKEKHWWLYILELEKNKWYVGITSKTPKKRLHEHKIGRGANWTRLYKPVEVHYTKDLGVVDVERARLYEGRVTRKYMEKYGDNNVRGGDLVDTEEYVRHFGYFWKKRDWSLLFFGCFFFLLSMILLVDKYLM